MTKTKQKYSSSLARVEPERAVRPNDEVPRTRRSTLRERCNEHLRSQSLSRGVREDDETNTPGIFQESFFLRDGIRRAKSLREHFRETTLLELLAMPEVTREAYHRKVSSQHPTYLEFLETWASPTRIALQYFAGLGGTATFVVNRVGWLVGSAIILAYLASSRTQTLSSGAWFVLLNHVLLNGIQMHILGISIIESLDEGPEYYCKTGTLAEDFEVHCGRFCYLVRARKGPALPREGTRGEATGDSDVGNSVEGGDEDGFRFFFDPESDLWDRVSQRTIAIDLLTLAVTLINFIVFSFGSFATLAVRVSDIISGYASGAMVPLSSWVEPVSFMLFIVCEAQHCALFGCVLWNLAHITDVINMAFDVLLQSVSQCQFEDIDDVELLATAYPTLVRIVRDLSAVITAKLWVPALLHFLCSLFALTSFGVQSLSNPDHYCVPGWQLGMLCTLTIVCMVCLTLLGRINFAATRVSDIVGLARIHKMRRNVTDSHTSQLSREIKRKQIDVELRNCTSVRGEVAKDFTLMADTLSSLAGLDVSCAEVFGISITERILNIMWVVLMVSKIDFVELDHAAK